MRFKLLFFLLFSILAPAQKGKLTGVITCENKPVANVIVSIVNKKKSTETNGTGEYVLQNLSYGTYAITVNAKGYESINTDVLINSSSTTMNFALKVIITDLNEVIIKAEREKTFGMTRLKAVDGFGIYEAKKSEVIVLKDITANLATNNARQVFAKVPGLNIWENDGVGLQLGIGGRGLSPNRTANFNTRQNGYDIAADALGYPESYYTPPTEALERIEVVRGAAALQYGTQFGGMINFKIRQGNSNKKIEITTRQSIGSWNFLNSFTSLGGEIGKLNYYTFYQRKQGDGWRPNSAFQYDMVYGGFKYKATEKLSFSADYTYMNYLAKQAGGLTDFLFEQNARQSVRSRNWFKVDWNLASFSIDYAFSPETKLNSRNFGIIARRLSLGNLERINVADFGQNRDLIDGLFRNFGNETRLLHSYKIGSQRATFLTGFRYYRGNADSKQGEGDNTSDPNFTYLNPNNLENSDFSFPSRNYSFFIENIFNLNEKISLTPGFRYENIQTFSSGYYKQRVFDGAGNLIVDNRIDENQERKRSFPIFGLGLSFKPNDKVEVYSNFSQNYRAINFNDIRVTNPNIIIDPNIKDEKGFSADIGLRGNWKEFFNFDASIFMVKYNDRIGLLLKADQPPLFLDYRYRTNIADALNIGFESYAEVNILKMFNPVSLKSVTVFTNFAFINARYINTDDSSIVGKQVELVPPITFRTGLTYSSAKLSSTLQYNYTAEHFTDATNALRSSTAVNGVIPAYSIVDFSMKYNFKKYFTLEASCNNMLDARYFTRRADAYPGPGIIPSDGRAFYVTVGFKL